MQELLMDTKIRFGIIAVLVLLTLFLAVESISGLKQLRFIGSGVPATNTIAVQGDGEVFAVPDIAQFSFGVIEEAKTTTEAQNSAAEKINNVTAFLRDEGVEEKDIKTVVFNVYPRYEFPEIRCITFPCPQGERQLVGFEVNQTVQVKVRATQKAGELLSGLADFGVQQISGLSFTIDDDEALQAEARQMAIDNAKEKAEQLADALGVRLVRVVSFSEFGGGFSPRFVTLEADVAVGRGGGVVPEIPIGENKIVSQVSVTYEIR